jgi:hypothetical protein
MTDSHATLRAGLDAHADCDYRLDADTTTATFACGVTVDYTGADGIADIKREHLARALAADRLRAEGWDAAIKKVYADRFRAAIEARRPGFPKNPYRTQQQEKS